MDFIFSPILWLLPLAAVPLILHLINNRRFKFIEFGAMRFISSLKSESIKKINLINILLLILRILIILFIILAISRPTVKGSADSFLEDSSTKIVIVIDDTYSNLNINIYEKQRTKILNTIESIIERYGPQAMMEILSVSKDLLYSGYISDFNILDISVSETYLNGKIAGLVNSYFNSDSSDYLNLDMYILSDLDKNSFGSIDSSQKWRVSFIDIAENQPLPAIKSLELNNLTVLPSDPFSITMKIHNNNQDFFGDINAYLNVDGMELFHKVSINRVGEYLVKFNALVSSQGSYNITGWIESENQTIFDTKFLNIEVLPDLKVGLCDLDDTYTSKYLNASTKAISDEGLISINQCGYSYEDFILRDLVVIDKFDYLNDDIVSQYLLSGGHVVLVPSFNTPQAQNPDFSLSNGQYAIRKEDILSKDVYTHIFDRMEGESLFELNKLFVLPLNSTSIIELANIGSIWNRDFSRGGTLDILGFDFNIQTSNFPLKGAWLPFIHYLISNAGVMADGNVFLGDSQSLRFQQQKNGIDIAGPEGYYEKTNSNSEVSLNNIERPGFYTILSDKDTLFSFSANVDSSEVLSGKINTKLLKQMFDNNCYVFDGLEDLELNLDLAEKGYEIWHILLSIAIVLLILESTIINAFERKV